MSVIAHIVMLGWIPVVFVLFAMGRVPAQSIVIAYLTGWLFLPRASYSFQGVPDYDKFLATNLGVVLAALLFDKARLLTFRPKWFDLPMLAWCLCPFASSITNELGAYDGLSAAFSQTVMWGVPYLIGRVYLSDSQGMRYLSRGIIIAALVYVPLVLYEIRMSPQLHRLVYGFHTRANFEISGSYGTLQWQPTVFMNSAFEITMLMGAAFLAGFWLWRTRALKHIFGFPLSWIVPLLFAMTVLCKKLSGIALMAMGIGILVLTRSFPTRVFIIALILVPPLYIAGRGGDFWSGEPLPSLVSNLSQRRSETLMTRFENEDRLVTKALQRPIFGWGRWGRSRVRDHTGRDISLTDGLWVITIGQDGIVGLTALLVSVLLPLVLFTKRFPPKTWSYGTVAPMVPMVILLGLHMVDNLLNAFPNPIYMLAAGGIVGAHCWEPTHAAEPVRSDIAWMVRPTSGTGW